MLKIETLKKQLEHYTNEMLDMQINWWYTGNPIMRDLLIPRMIEEKLLRMELDYEEKDRYRKATPIIP